MKYGPIPENPFERLALLSGKVPVPVLDAIFSLMKARCLMGNDYYQTNEHLVAKKEAVAARAGDTNATAMATSWKNLKVHFTDRSLCLAKPPRRPR